MAQLKTIRRLPLAPYTPKPGDSMDTHVEVKLYRDTDRKQVRLSMSTLSIVDKGSCIAESFRLSGPGMRVVIADMLTHSPKVFTKLEADFIGSIDRKEGETWERLLRFLSEAGLALA